MVLRKKNTRRLKKKKAEKNFPQLSPTAKFAHLVTYYGDDGVLGLQKVQIPKQFQKHLGKMKKELGVLLQPLVTLEEREMLVEISRCSNVAEVEAILPTWYTRKNMSANCRFIKFALTASLEIWSTKSLLNKGHGEYWYRMHIYSNVWDKAFFDNVQFETKRSECASQVTKALKETNKNVKLQKLDSILRDLNTNNDVVAAEEKPYPFRKNHCYPSFTTRHNTQCGVNSFSTFVYIFFYEFQ